MIAPSVAPPIARPRLRHPAHAGAARAVPSDVIGEAIGELDLWAEMHERAGEESGDRFYLNRASEIRAIVGKLRKLRISQ